MEKTIEVNDIVKAFNLEVLTAEDELDRLVSKSTSRRPGLEFIDYLDYLPMGHVQVLGVNEIHFLHTLENEERRERIENLESLPMGHVDVLGGDEMHFLHTLENEERRERIENLVRYTPPCFIVTDNQTGLVNMVRYCTERNIPLLRAVESNYEFIGKLDA